MLHLGKGRRRTASAALVAGLTALTMMFLGASTGSVSAATSTGPGAAKTISNELVEIKPAKVTGTFTNEDTGKQGRMVAKFTPTEFVENDGKVAVEGILSGVFTGAKLPDGTPRHFSEPVTFDVTDARSTGDATAAGFQSTGATSGGFAAAGFVPASSHGCDILHLDLGPLDLNLLGLQIDLSQIVLDIVAQPGAGNLLGNLLCAVAGLLDPGSPLDNLLDNLLEALNGLLTGLIGDLEGLLEDLLGGLGGLTGAQSA